MILPTAAMKRSWPDRSWEPYLRSGRSVNGAESIWKLHWLVVESYPSEKYEFVNWDDDIPNWMRKWKMFQTTKQCKCSSFAQLYLSGHIDFNDFALNIFKFRPWKEMIPLIDHGSGLRPGREVAVTYPDLPRSIDSTGKNSVHGWLRYLLIKSHTTVYRTSPFLMG